MNRKYKGSLVKTASFFGYVPNSDLSQFNPQFVTTPAWDPPMGMVGDDFRLFEHLCNAVDGCPGEEGAGCDFTYVIMNAIGYEERDVLLHQYINICGGQLVPGYD